MKHSLIPFAIAGMLTASGVALAQTATPVLPGAGNKGPTTPATQNPDKSDKPQTAPKPTKKPEKAPSPQITEATKAYNAGIKALGKNDLSTAGDNFAKALQLSPQDANAALYLGYVRLKQQRWQDAVSALEKSNANSDALDDSLKPIMWNNLGLAYAKTSHSKKALAAYQQALTLDKTYVDARYNLAFAQLAADDYKNAIDNFLALRDSKTDDKSFQASVYDGLASAYEGQQNWGKALGAYRQVVKLNGSNPDSRFNFALALKKAGRRDDAIVQLRTLLALHDAYQPAISLLGSLYLETHQWPQAAKVLEQYTKAAPKNHDAWFNLGVAYDHASNFGNALRAYGQAQKLDAKDAAVNNNMGRIYFKQKKYDKAVTALQKALVINPDFTDARLNLALVLMAQENWTDAAKQWKTYLLTLRDELRKPDITDSEKIAISEQGTNAHSALALCYMHAELYADARDQYKKLLVAQPDNLDAQINLALCYYHTKSYVQSVKLSRKIIAAHPKNAIAYNNLGVTLEAMNRVGEALQNYKKAAAIDPTYADAKNNVKRIEANTAQG